jgi:hypothetical protein
MLTAKYIGLNPKIAVEKPEHIVQGCFAEVTIGDVINEIDIKDAKYLHSELERVLYPDGLIPDDFHEKIAMLNQLIDDLDIRDRENPDWKLSKIEYIGGDEDITYFECMEVAE